MGSIRYGESKRKDNEVVSKMFDGGKGWIHLKLH